LLSLFLFLFIPLAHQQKREMKRKIRCSFTHFQSPPLDEGCAGREPGIMTKRKINTLAGKVKCDEVVIPT